MVYTDISNIWSQVSLPELLGLEAEIFDAHQALDCGDWLKPGELRRIIQTAEKIREESRICVVLGTGAACLGARGAVELLRGKCRNPEGEDPEPQLLFAGDSLSTRQWNGLCRALEGKDFSVIAVSSDMETQTLVTLRGLRWMLERKYGTDEANCRIYTVTPEQEGLLRRMTLAEGWESFTLPQGLADDASLLRAGGLLPMAVAGLDVEAVVRGAGKAGEAGEEYDLRSFENPAWLYAGARRALGRSGIPLELMVCTEPDFSGLSRWWQRLFAGEKADAPFPVAGDGLSDVLPAGTARIETILRFDPPEQRYTILEDAREPEELKHLEGKTLDEVEELTLQETIARRADGDIGVISLDCGALDEEKLGELVWFFQLSRGLCRPVSPETDRGAQATAE